MLKSEKIDRFCRLVIAFAVTLSLVLMAVPVSLQQASAEYAYENKLFDTTFVHEINIEMEGWDSFIETCEDEQYAQATLVIDGTVFKNVAIRAKGNTSLSSVSSYGNNRYSFKVEFDHYKSSETCWGLDKLCLNNLIQDATYLKDYIAYTLMNKMGVKVPLCAFAWIQVNGGDWGLYLMVEGIEDSFLARNGVKSTADLYKPDSMSFGGGRGNGRGFDAEEFFGNGETETQVPELPQDNMGRPEMPQGGFGQDGGTPPEMPQGGTDQISGNLPEMPQGGFGQNGNTPPEMPQGGTDQIDGNLPEMPQGGFGQNGGTPPEMPQGGTDQIGGNLPEMPQGGFGQDGNTPPEMPQGGFGGGNMPSPGMMQNNGAFRGGFGGMNGGRENKPDAGGMAGMGSDDTKLIYTDDDFDSYSNIFDSAKTTVTDADKTRLIAALKRMNEGNVESSVAVDDVITYMAVHNFMVNGDSYTGSMVHNYYLLEQDGILSMIPWDYNLSFGAFDGGRGGNATSSVNTSIDEIASSDRPMANWIMNSEMYMERYHETYARFIETVFESGWFDGELSRVTNLISPYVEKDTNGFYTYAQFTKAISSLKIYVDARVESIKAQLGGNKNPAVSAAGISVSDMGSMGNMGGGKQEMRGKEMKREEHNEEPRENDKLIPYLVVTAAVLVFALFFAVKFRKR